MTTTPRRWIAMAALLVVAVALVIVLSRPDSAIEVSNVTKTTTATAKVEHPPMSPLNVSADDSSSLRAALERNPGHLPILMRMAELAREQGNWGEAVTHLRQAVEAEPGNADARLELGRALYESGDVEGAVRETSQIVERDPNHVDALYNLGAIHANQKQNDLASNYWSRAVAADPASESGRNAQRGLDTLNGRVTAGAQAGPTSIPDIPEHRNVRRSKPAPAVDPKKALIEFATKQ